MSDAKPATYGLPSILKEEFLSTVSTWFLEEWRSTEDDLIRDTDTTYTRGTTRFGRQKQRINLENKSGRHSWLRVENSSNDIVFSIMGIPCRFSNDDVDAPKKRAVLEVHPFQMPLLQESEPGEAARFVFVVDRNVFEFGEPKVTLLGFSSSGYEVCRWVSGDNTRVLGDAQISMPAPVEIARPLIMPKRPAASAGKQDDSSADTAV